MLLLALSHAEERVSLVSRRWLSRWVVRRDFWVVPALCSYLATLLVLLRYHEIWRDEGRAYSIAAEATSLADLFERLNNEGHPALWYLILYGGLRVVRTPLVLQTASALIAVAAMAVLFVRSPFPIWQRLLFSVGFFPIYEYSVVARNYGIAMLLLFCFAAYYKQRFERPVLMGSIGFLLAQTNAYGLIMAAAIGVSLGCQYLLRNVQRSKRDYVFPIKGTMLLGLSMIALGCWLSKLTITPDEFIKGPHAPESISKLLGQHWLTAIEEPVKYFGAGFGLENFNSPQEREIGRLLLLVAAACLVRRPDALLIFAVGYIGMGVLATGVYHAFPRHQGCVYLLWVASYWIAYSPLQPKSSGSFWGKLSHRAHWSVSTAVFTVLLVLQIPPAVRRIEFDYRYEISSVKRMGTFLRNNPKYSGAIVVGEPDMFMEALPCYAPNPIYNVRESRFKGYGDFDRRKNRERLSIEELLAAARSLRDRERKPVVIALRYHLNPDGPYEIRTDTGWLLYSRRSYEEFVAGTTPVAEFRGSQENNEDFDLFAVK